MGAVARWWWACGAAVALAGCAGNELTSAAQANRAPVAVADADLVVKPGSPVVLDGWASHDPDGDPLSHRWRLTQVPAGSNAQLAHQDAAETNFVADVPGAYQVRLVVNDGLVDSAADLLVIRAERASSTGDADAGSTADAGATADAGSPADAGATADAGPPNTPPVAVTGADRRVEPGTEVLLDGSASVDPDGDPLRYRWSMARRPVGSQAALSTSDVVSPSFTTDLTGEYALDLVVDDGAASSAPARVLISARHPQPSAPGDVVVTEVMADPDGAISDAQGEWFELYNPTARTLDLEGCEIADLGGERHTLAAGGASVVMPPGAHLTLARSATPGFAPDYVYGGFLLANGADEVVVRCGGIAIDQVVYDAAWPSAPGYSTSLMTSRYDQVANDELPAWCLATSSYATDNRGTPGALNDQAQSCL